MSNQQSGADGRTTSTHHLTLDQDAVHKRFVSWGEGEAEREWHGLTALDRVVPGLAPQPIRREQHDGAPVVVMARIPGTPLGDERVTPAQTRALADSLRRLFSAPVDRGMPERALGPGTMRAHVRAWASDTYDLSQCRDPHAVLLALTSLRDRVSVDDPEHDQIVDPVLARGDGNLANILWDGRTCRFVDFEEFGRSDLTYELADLVEHASSRLAGLLDVTRLLAAFDLTPTQERRLLAHRRLLAAFWLVMLLPGNRGFWRNPPGSTESQARHLLELLELSR